MSKKEKNDPYPSFNEVALALTIHSKQRIFKGARQPHDENLFCSLKTIIMVFTYFKYYQKHPSPLSHVSTHNKLILAPQPGSPRYNPTPYQLYC